jgi:Domain of unknown function (DUF5063)
MSHEAVTSYVREYCEWAEAAAHDLPKVHRLLLRLIEGVVGLKTRAGRRTNRKPPGLPQDVSWSETKRFADLPFQCYPPFFWPEVHPQGQFTDNIHEDLAHIYAELRHGLQLTEQGRAEAAVQYWRDSYFFHWGHHAAAAVWAIEFHDPKIKGGEPGAPPNGGPATPSGNLRVPEGPPSVS